MRDFVPVRRVGAALLTPEYQRVAKGHVTAAIRHFTKLGKGRALLDYFARGRIFVAGRSARDRPGPREVEGTRLLILYRRSGQVISNRRCNENRVLARHLRLARSGKFGSCCTLLDTWQSLENPTFCSELRICYLCFVESFERITLPLVSSSPLNEIESVTGRIGHVRHVSKIGTPQDWPIELRASSNCPLNGRVELVDDEVEVYRCPMSLMVSLDPPFRTPRQSEKEGLFSERHRRPPVPLLHPLQTQGVTVEAHGALDIL